ncbi:MULTISPECIES: biopolymer transporter Tol [unclassified Rhizobium]|jgi:Tol biopolymer transport system component|uniref:TolB family protein n=1 Tax=unclassified Rhizobium TaxID=2613769 RepID=UPI000ADFBD07|nr:MULTISPECIES: biopolymer transporter Tol [unclassified Rhizobium]RKD67933.1 WD40 repeat protein [Rhizobium sp. WW_1]
MPSMRPGPETRRLLPRQISELVVFDMATSTARVIYETGELIEAPNWSPDGKWLIYNGDGRLFRISPDGQDGPHRVNTAPVENLNNDHVVSPDGRSFFVSANDGHLYQVPFEGGAPRRVSNEHEASRSFKYYLHGISPDGATLAYIGLERREGGGIFTRVCTIPSAGGDDVFLTDGACPVDGSEFSPDGKWIYFNSEAAATQAGHAQAFRMRLDGSGLEQLTHDQRVNWFPHPAPNGRDLVYLSYPVGTLGHPADKDVILRLMSAAGGKARDLDAFNGGQGTINVNSWAPDSSAFAYIRYPAAG